MIASKVNEDEKLTAIEGGKSMNMRLLMNTTDTRVSPVVDAQRVSTVLTSNRVNNIITNFATDSRVNTLMQIQLLANISLKRLFLSNLRHRLRFW